MRYRCTFAAGVVCRELEQCQFESNFSAIGDRTLSNSKPAAVSNCRRRGDADASNKLVATVEIYYGVGAGEGAFIPPRISGMFISL